MFYRETGQFKTNYADDMALLPILQDRIGLGIILFVAYVIIPFFGNDFLLSTVMIPFLVFSLAAIGLNILTGFTGLISLGTGAFMGVGAYACYKVSSTFPDLNILFCIVFSGVFSALVGVLFGLPSLRIKGFYLAVATLAAQFFLQWCLVRIPWLYNYNVSGAIEVSQRSIFGVIVTGAKATPESRYIVMLVLVTLMTWVAANVLSGRIGRAFMAVRDMDIAAELMGIDLLKTKLLAFAFSSFYAGVAGAAMMFIWVGGGEANDSFNINQSFLILFMVIIGGLGSLLGAFLGAAFISSLPTILKFGLPAIGIPLAGATAEHLTYILVGGLILFFLIVEPHGLARLWQIGKQKLRMWPFPY
jgi:branched-chain amino acid transport system permease protein